MDARGFGPFGMMMQDDHNKPFRRQVFFISGFDPRGVLFLQKNCATETERWSKITSIPVTMGPRKSVGKLAKTWPIEADFETGKVETRFDFLQWDDIIRDNWERRTWAVFLTTVQEYLLYLRWGIIAHAIRVSWPIAITMSAPTVVALLNVLSVLFLAAGVLMVMAGGGIIWTVASLAIMALGAAASLYVLATADRYKPDWNARIGHFAINLARGKVPQMHVRIDEFIDHIIASIDADKPDEAVLIGHSFGTAIATMVASRLIERRPDLAQAGSPFALVTLGQTQSMLPLMPPADWFRADLDRFAAHPAFTWIDVSSPPDGACYALVNILEDHGAPKSLPRHINAQFHKAFSQDRMDAARRERMIMHFFYLMAPDNPDQASDLYDFVLLIAGPQSVGSRYGRRKSQHGYFNKKGGQT